MKYFITGTAGFIGFHLSRLLLESGAQVHGYDGITPYYDQRLKQARHTILRRFSGFSANEAMLEDRDTLRKAALRFQPGRIVHLAAQAGVRYSLENPAAYVDANLVGTFNVLEVAREIGIEHLMLASTSSVYGANQKMPFSEDDASDAPLTLYAATKKSTELMAHSYASLWNIPTTSFRFFSVYGAWGRPDMALFKFTQAILAGQPIDLYNHGKMQRDFTYVGDLVKAITLLADCPPQSQQNAPFQVVNIGNAAPVPLLDFVAELELLLGRMSLRNLMPMQVGDVPATWADTTKLRALTGFQPNTSVREGIRAFVDWYLEYYGHNQAKVAEG